MSLRMATPNGTSETVDGQRRSVCIHCGDNVSRPYPSTERWRHHDGEIECEK